MAFSGTASGSMPGVAVADDPYLWLESMDSPAVHRWVADRNAETLAGLGGAGFARRQQFTTVFVDTWSFKVGIGI